MSRYFLDSRGWPMHDSKMKEAFGLRAKAKWPREGMERRFITGVLTWVAVLQPGPFRIRVLCNCPRCSMTLAASRLNQHMKVHNKGGV